MILPAAPGCCPWGSRKCPVKKFQRPVVTTTCQTNYANDYTIDQTSTQEIPAEVIEYSNNTEESYNNEPQPLYQAYKEENQDYEEYDNEDYQTDEEYLDNYDYEYDEEDLEETNFDDEDLQEDQEDNFKDPETVEPVSQDLYQDDEDLQEEDQELEDANLEEDKDNLEDMEQEEEDETQDNEDAKQDLEENAEDEKDNNFENTEENQNLTKELDDQFLEDKDKEIKEVLFDFNGKKIKTTQEDILKSNLGRINQLALKGHQIVVEGHSYNPKHSEDNNLKISRKRAESVAKYLIENGVDKDSIQILAQGDKMPLSNNQSDLEGLNHRVEIYSYKKA